MSDSLNGCPGCGQHWLHVQRAAVGRIYGGQDYPGNFHQTGFTQQLLLSTLTARGFRGGQILEKDHQFLNWNFKVAVRKF